jgi:endonuclease G
MKVFNKILIISSLILISNTVFPQDEEMFLPPSSNIVQHKFYSLMYNEKHEQATWVSYMICRDRLNGPWERSNDFREDPDVTTGSATLADYQGSGYDRGHLAPADDFSFDSVGMSESFYLSNMSPQVGSCNRGIWKRLENEERRWADKYDTLYITAGPILTDSLITIGEDKVSVPDFYYKVILNKSGNQYKGIGFIIPNRKEQAKIKNFVVPIRFIESITAIDFFPDLPDSIENNIEQNLNTDQWGFHAN